MRNPEKISISYGSQCRRGVYDLAENKLVHYPSNKATYDEVKNEMINYIDGQASKHKKTSSDKEKINEKLKPNQKDTQK